MAYLGNNPDAYQYTIEISRFNGTGACTQFTIPQDVDNAKDIEVLVNSVQQDPDNAYTVTDGVITFSEAPTTGSNNIIVLRRTGTTYTRTQIAAGDILPNAVTSAAIADGSITSAKIADGTVIAADIAANTITPAKIAYNTSGTILTTDGTRVLWQAQSALGIANTQITGVMTATQLANTAVTSGVYGGASNVASFTVDAQGRLTAASNVTIETGFNPFLLSGM
mgnify:FL=1